MRTRYLLSILLVLAASLSLAAPAVAAPGKGKYQCYNYSATGILYSGYFTILSSMKYKPSSGKTATYSYSRGRVKFRTGPYRGWTGKYKKSKGDDVINVYNKRGYVMTCTH